MWKKGKKEIKQKWNCHQIGNGGIVEWKSIPKGQKTINNPCFITFFKINN